MEAAGSKANLARIPLLTVFPPGLCPVTDQVQQLSLALILLACGTFPQTGFPDATF